MAVTVSGAEKIKSEFHKILRQVDSPEVMRKLGHYIISVIRVRTRGTGRGVKNVAGNPSKLKSVSRPYAIWRATQDRHAEAATGRESNLTLTGKMLNSMIVKKATASSLFIGFRGQKQEDKAVYQEQQGRRFLVLSGKEIRSAANFILAQLRK